VKVPISWPKMFLLLLLAGVWSVHGHGGMVWPPIWQDGNYLALDDVYNNTIRSNPTQHDPKTGKAIDNTKSWVTDQAYTGGHGAEFKGNGTYTDPGNHTNYDHCSMKLSDDYGDYRCEKLRHPWAAPGQAPSLGGGCGIHGGNPYGCPARHDSRSNGSQCGQGAPGGPNDRGTWSFGSSALEVDFPQATVTRWVRGTTVPVGFVAIYHGGGYTYRLCKLPAEGKAGLTEECFARNILEFAEDKTYYRDSSQWSDSEGAWLDNRGKGWETSKQKSDLTVGTYPEGSAWRYAGPIDKVNWHERFFKDLVKVPEDLEPGEYVLSWRWDAASAPQVWVSCANIEIVAENLGRR